MVSSACYFKHIHKDIFMKLSSHVKFTKFYPLKISAYTVVTVHMYISVKVADILVQTMRMLVDGASKLCF